MAEPATRVPVEPGYFTIPAVPDERPRLLGSRCLECSEVFFPSRHVCACCFSQRLEDCELGPRGTLYTWTYVHVPMFGALRADAGGYAVGQVDLPEGPRVQAVLEGGPEDFAIGMDLELDLETLRVDSEQREVVIFRFRPVPSAGAAEDASA
jgi:uncharacterized OB-fold protein